MDSYETILQRMKSNFNFKAGYTPSDASDTGIRLQTAAAEIFDCMLYAQWLRKQMFVASAEGDSLDRVMAVLRRQREAEARLFVRLDTPFYTGVRMELAEWVALRS